MRVCPFCNYDEGWVKETSFKRPIKYRVECHVCGAAGPEANSHEMAIKKWDGLLAKIDDDKKFKAALREDAMGGVAAPMATLNNTPGMGNAIPGSPSTGGMGSGDKWGNIIGGKPYTQGGKTKKKKPTKKRKIVKEGINVDILDDFIIDLSNKYGSGLDVYLPEEKRNQLYDLIVNQKYKIKIISWEKEDDEWEDGSGPSDEWESNNISIYTDKGWEEFFTELQDDFGEVILIKKPIVKENNVNPYDKIGQMMLKRANVKTPFKKKKASGNQNAMTQRKFEHEIMPLDDYLNEGASFNEDYRKQVMNFLDTPWQEDTEIELVSLINEYRDRILSEPKFIIQDYIKRLYNSVGHTLELHCSDEFILALQNLLI